MEVRHSLDTCLLEQRLVERLARRADGGLSDPCLVLVPTRRLAAHLERRIAARVPAALALHVLTHRALALASMRHALTPPPRVLPRAALESLLDRLLAGSAAQPAAYLRSHAGSRAALCRSFNDLREACVPPPAFAAAVGTESPDGSLVADLYRRYDATLARLGARGWTDSAGLITAALPFVAPFLRAKRISAALHHGAYELVGANQRLLEAVAAVVKTEFLLPGSADRDGEDPSYPQRFLDNLGKTTGRVEPLAVGATAAAGRRAAWLAGRRSSDAAAPAPDNVVGPPIALEIQNCQGAAAELHAAALRAVALHGGSDPAAPAVPLDEIVIVARSLEPYTPHLEAVFDALRVPFTTSASRPLRRDPAVGTLLGLLRVLGGNLERRAVIQLLRRPALDLSRQATGLDQAPPGKGEIDLWDRRSRQARIVSSLASWRELPHVTRELRRAAATDDDDVAQGRLANELDAVRKLLDVLQVWDEARLEWEGCVTLRDHLRFLDRLARRWLRGASGAESEPPAAVGRLLRVLRAAVDAVEEAGVAIAPADNVRLGPTEVEDLVDRVALAERVPISDGDRGGVRVLDLMQARGMTHRAVIWLGFHHGLFPRRPRPDRFLPDPLRERLAASSRVHMPLRSEGDAEERLLFVTTMASSRERLILSFQRADEDGTKIARSSAFRDVARLFTGKADAGALLDEAAGHPFAPLRVPAHPGERAVSLARIPRLAVLPSADAVVAAAVLGTSGTAGARSMRDALGARDSDGDSILDWVDRIEEFRPGDGGTDGFTGIGLAPDHTFYPSAIERLSRCPLAFFLRDVLHVRELDEEAVPHVLEARILGSAVHETLDALYRQLDAEGGFASPDGAKHRWRDVLPGLWWSRLERAAGSSFGRLRGLFTILGERWLGTLERFVERDVDEIAAVGAKPIGFEKTLSAVVSLEQGGRPRPLHLAGRLDRVFRAGDEIWVDDYKTGSTLAGKKDPVRMLRGENLQLPLYRELVAASFGKPWAEVRARLLGVGPKAEQKNELKNERQNVVAEIDPDANVREGILESVAVALSLASDGRFPLLPSRRCRFCGYRRTCRRTHQPTLSRLEADPSLADFRDVQEKKPASSTLGAVRQARRAAAEEAAAAGEGGR